MASFNDMEDMVGECPECGEQFNKDFYPREYTKMVGRFMGSSRIEDMECQECGEKFMVHAKYEVELEYD